MRSLAVSHLPIKIAFFKKTEREGGGRERENEWVAEAIIEDKDRKSWYAQAPMIWDNFAIFRTNCATGTMTNLAPRLYHLAAP